MKKFSSFLFVAVFLLSGCSSISGDYSKVESLDVVMADINDNIIKCHYEKGYNINCERYKNEKN